MTGLSFQETTADRQPAANRTHSHAADSCRGYSMHALGCKLAEDTNKRAYKRERNDGLHILQGCGRFVVACASECAYADIHCVTFRGWRRFI